MTESRDRKSDLVTYIIVIIIIIIIIIIIYMYLIRKTICNTLELAVLETASRPTLFYSYGNYSGTYNYLLELLPLASTVCPEKEAKIFCHNISNKTLAIVMKFGK